MNLWRSALMTLGVATGLAFTTGRPASPTATPQLPLEGLAPQAAELGASITPLAETRPSSAPSPEILELREDLSRLISNLATANSAHGVLVVSLDRGDTLFSHNPDLPLAPASNMKLFSTAAALYYLGPDFRYSTFALTTGPIRNGVLEGDLILYGTGDPAISSRMLPGALTPLRALTDSLKARGIREIRGDIIGDGSYFDDHWIAEGWREEYRLDSYSAPVGALSLGENIVSVRVDPGPGAGRPASIRTTPSTDGLLIQNRVQTVASGSSSVRFAYDPDGLVIEGRIAMGHPGVARTVTVIDPANFAAAAFREVLTNAGIAVTGTVRTVRDREESPVGFVSAPSNGTSTPPARVVGTHISPTLAELVTVTNHISQNLYAEAFFKTAGRVALGEGTFAGGAKAVQFLLECEGAADLPGLRIVDGSGLSPLNRVTPRSIIHLLDLMTRTDVWEIFDASLPEAASPNGGQHSLRGRMGGTPAARNLRAKTGTIANVSGLSGYVRSADGELLAFSILTNEIPSTSRAKRTEDAIGIRLARFARPVDSPEAVPVGVPVATAEIGGSDTIDAVSSDNLSGTEGIAGSPNTTGADGRVNAPAPQVREHTVQRGQTMDGIARRYGTSVTELRRMNPGIEPRRLQVGQTLRIPAP